MNNFEEKKVVPSDSAKERQQRKLGILLTAVSSLVIIWVIWQLSFEPARIRAITESVSPLNSFPDVFRITDSPMALYSVIGAGAFVVLWTGIYRIINGRPGMWHKFAAFLVGFAIIIGHAMYINSVREPVFDELVSIQHEWADERYGIIYDEVTILETKGRKNKTIKNQDKVVWQGDIIAEICKPDRATVLFCEPGTTDELFVVAGW